MIKTPLAELKSRIFGLQSGLCAADIDGALIVQNVDLFYYTGTAQNAYLYVPQRGEPVLMVKKDFDRSRAESGLPQVVRVRSIKDIPSTLTKCGHQLPQKLGLELDVLPASQYLFLQELLSPAAVVDISAVIKGQRAVKSPYELEIMRNSARLTDSVFARIPSLIKRGMSEIELAGQVEALFRSIGHPGIVHMRGLNQEMVFGHLLSGASMAVPSCVDSPTGGEGVGPHFPQGAGFKAIAPDEPLQVDYVGSFNGYLIDQTRIYVTGRLDDRLEFAHHTALSIQEAIISRARPGTPAGELYQLAQSMAEENGLAANFMGPGKSCGFVGHGIGLELNELPVLAPGLKMPLAEGMTIALEPKFIFPGLGACGIENTFAVTGEGLKRLGSLPDDITYIEI